MSSRREKLIHKQITKAIKSPDVNLIFMPNNNDLSECYVLVRNLQSDIYPEWEGGVYLLKIIMGDSFPMQPPKFYLYTENGVYQTGTTALCISIGHFHAENWRPVLGLIGFAKEIANGMMNREFLIELGGLGLVKSSPEKIRSLAQSSLSSIATKHSDLLEEMTEYYKEYSAKWDFSKTDQDDLVKLKFRGIVPGLKKSVSVAKKTTTYVTVNGVLTTTGNSLDYTDDGKHCKTCGTPIDKTTILQSDIVVNNNVKLDDQWVVENSVEETIENIEEIYGKVTTNRITATTIVTSKLTTKPTEPLEQSNDVVPPAHEPLGESPIVMSVCEDCKANYKSRIITVDKIEVVNTFTKFNQCFVNTIVETAVTETTNKITETTNKITNVIKSEYSMSVDED